jgi:hypothetical protein
VISKEQEELVKAGLRIDREHKRRKAVGRIADGVLVLLMSAFLFGMYLLCCWAVSYVFGMFGKDMGVIDAGILILVVGVLGSAWRGTGLFGGIGDLSWDGKSKARRRRERE